MGTDEIDFTFEDGSVKISQGTPFYEQKVTHENMAIYFLLGRTLLEIQQFENHVSFALSMLQLMEARATPTKDINQIGSELREKNSLLTLGQAISRLSRFVKDPRIIDELGSIKRERNKLVHHFWRVLDWPFQEQSEIKREYELADHLYKRMTYGEIALLEYIQSNDPRIKIHVGAIDLETKKIIMEDGSEASRLKK